MFSLEKLLLLAGEKKASDIHLTLNNPPILRIDGLLVQLDAAKLTGADLETAAGFLMNERQAKRFAGCRELDISFMLEGIGRYRINFFRQQGSIGVVIRLIPFMIPDPQILGLPLAGLEFAKLQKGLVLVSGPAGSGKSTTLASLIDYINRSRACHIVTIEDPIEYLHKQELSLINQREVGHDTQSFARAMRAVLRQDPDVIMVGEMRDRETITTAVTAAETGHLVFSTLHTSGATQSVDRIIDAYSQDQQLQVRGRLAAVLEGVISQQLLPRADHKGRIAAFEVLVATSAVRNLIREGKTHQLSTVMQTNAKAGMQTMDKAVLDLVQDGLVSYEIAKEKLTASDCLMR